MSDMPSWEELPDRTVLARRRELPRVVYELHKLRQEYLPALLSSRRLIYSGGRPTLAPGRTEETARRLHQWRSAILLLMQALSLRNDRSRRLAALQDFRAILAGAARASGWREDLLQLAQPDPCFEIGDWPPIVWRIFPVESSLPRERTARQILAWLGGTAGGEPDPWDELRRRFLVFRDKFLGTEVDFNQLALRYETWLPVVADIDPAFAIEALDFQRLKASLVGERPLTQATGDFLASVVSCGAACTLAILANNHFLSGYDLLRKPEVFGNWRGFMPVFVAAVLYHKVRVLRQLAGEPDG
jgi:hypothetical protein